MEGILYFLGNPMVVNKGKYCVPLPAFFLVGGEEVNEEERLGGYGSLHSQ